MSKAHYIPNDDASKDGWLSRFAAKLLNHSTALGLTAAETTAVAADAAFFHYALDAQHKYADTSQQWTAYKNAARGGTGTVLGNLPLAPTLLTAPTMVAPGIFRRISALVARIKNHPGYTEAIGEDLAIVGADQEIDLSLVKPVLTVVMDTGHPLVQWAKQGLDGVEIQVDRGTGTFSFLAVDTVPDYLDTAPLPPLGQMQVWKYRAMYRLGDQLVGLWSEVASINVIG